MRNWVGSWQSSRPQRTIVSDGRSVPSQLDRTPDMAGQETSARPAGTVTTPLRSTDVSLARKDTGSSAVSQKSPFADTVPEPAGTLRNITRSLFTLGPSARGRSGESTFPAIRRRTLGAGILRVASSKGVPVRLTSDGVCSQVRRFAVPCSPLNDATSTTFP